MRYKLISSFIVAYLSIGCVTACAETDRPQEQQGYANPMGRGMTSFLAAWLAATGQLNKLRAAASEGDANAQYILGSLYLNGEGVPTNYAKALFWLQKSANQNNKDAQFLLGVMYDNGEGVPQDYAQAVSWFRKAADQGYAAAQYNLGVMYANGQGVPQDYAQAVYWYRKAADQGDASAAGNLGSAYGLGRGVPQDYVLALKWLIIAKAEGNARVTQKILEKIESTMTPQQIAEGQSLARQWWNQHHPGTN
jgi:TPR repeat protein